MKQYEQPTMERQELTVSENLAAVVQSEPIVEDNDLTDDD